MRDFIFNNIVRQYSHWSTFIDYKVTAATVDINAFATSNDKTHVLSGALDLQEQLRDFNLKVNEHIAQLPEEKKDPPLVELQKINKNLSDIKGSNQELYCALIGLLEIYNEIDQLKPLSKIVGYAKYLHEEQTFKGVTTNEKQTIDDLLKELFKIENMKTNMTYVTEMYKDVRSQNTGIFSPDFNTDYEEYVRLYKLLIREESKGYIPPRDKILFYWTMHGLKLTFSDLQGTDVGNFKKRLRQIMTSLVLVNAMIDDMADNFKDEKLVSFLTQAFIGLDGYPRNERIKDDGLESYLSDLYTNVYKEKGGEASKSDVEATKTQESQSPDKNAAIAYAKHMLNVFYNALEEYGKLNKEYCLFLSDPSDQQESKASGTKQRSNSDLLTFKQVLLISFSDILKNFQFSCRFNKNPSEQNLVLAANFSHHNMSIVLFKQMVAAFNFDKGSIKSLDEMATEIQSNQQFTDEAFIEQKQGRYANIIATALSSNTKKSRELKVNDLSGQAEILEHYLNRPTPMMHMELDTILRGWKQKEAGEINVGEINDDNNSILDVTWVGFCQKYNAAAWVFLEFAKNQQKLIKDEQPGTLNLLLYYMATRGSV
tara:strand:+ start:1450 stop:3243 length:1794 start_codon:yes stop_codon:yes gene_type:complete